MGKRRGDKVTCGVWLLYNIMIPTGVGVDGRGQ